MRKAGLMVCGIAIVIGLIMIITSFLGKETTPEPTELQSGIDFTQEGNELRMSGYDTKNPVVAMKIKNYGAIVIELYPSVAPNTVSNFISLVLSGFYDNNTFHRLIPGFVLQGGDPTGKGNGGPGYSIKGEFTENGFTNDLKHTKGVVSMARASAPDTAGSQFFIMLGTSATLDGKYAAFGEVIDGMDIIEAIEQNEVVADKTSGKLQTNLTIEKAVIDLKGENYPAVEKIQ